MLEPTAFFKPFGEEGPKVVLFGRKTGDWNPSCFREPGDHQSNVGLYSRFNMLAEKYHFLDIAMPIPTDCNTRVCISADFTAYIQNGAGSVVLRRGVRADGMVLRHGSAGAIASADCPTIIAYCPTMKIAIVAHGGCKSLIDIGHVLHGNSSRENESVVDEIMKMAKAYRFCQIKVFVTCGISGKNYAFPELVLPVVKRFGNSCASTPCIDLKKIIARQFLEYGVCNITTDTIDTYEDCDIESNRLWHSYRRDKTPKRNLVLVVN